MKPEKRLRRYRKASEMIEVILFIFFDGFVEFQQIFFEKTAADAAFKSSCVGVFQRMSAKFQGYSVSLVPDVLLADGEGFELAGFSVKAILTPGHTGGGMSYYLPEEGFVFSGDTLFRHTYGRTDLPTSSFEELKYSLREKLFKLPEDTEVLPGHGNATTIKEERRRNPVLGD